MQKIPSVAAAPGTTLAPRALPGITTAGARVAVAGHRSEGGEGWDEEAHGRSRGGVGEDAREWGAGEERWEEEPASKAETWRSYDSADADGADGEEGDGEGSRGRAQEMEQGEGRVWGGDDVTEEEEQRFAEQMQDVERRKESIEHELARLGQHVLSPADTSDNSIDNTTRDGVGRGRDSMSSEDKGFGFEDEGQGRDGSSEGEVGETTRDARWERREGGDDGMAGEEHVDSREELEERIEELQMRFRQDAGEEEQQEEQERAQEGKEGVQTGEDDEGAVEL